MITRFLTPQEKLEVPTDPRLRSDLEIRAAVRQLLGTQHQHTRVGAERRREQRFPFPYPIRLTPVTTDGVVPPAESVVVLGKHINENGLDFYFKEPLPYRRVIATFERNGREVMHIVMELTWCRFGRHGWYENGGRFLQVLPEGRGLRVEGRGSEKESPQNGNSQISNAKSETQISNVGCEISDRELERR